MVDKEIPNHWTGQCFGCSRTSIKSLGLRFWLSEKGCYTKCKVPEYLCGIDGLVHGGIISLLLDEIAEWTMIARLGRIGVTRDMYVQFLKPVPTDSELMIKGEISDQDQKQVAMRSTICSSDDELLAEAKSNWILVSSSTIANISKVDEGKMQDFLAQYPIKGH